MRFPAANKLYMIDARRGTVVSTLSVPAPFYPAIDERLGRLVICEAAIPATPRTPLRMAAVGVLDTSTKHLGGALSSR